MTRQEILVLREAGVPGARVARQAAVSERSVWRIAKEAPVGDDMAPSAAVRRAVGRPSTAAPCCRTPTPRALPRRDLRVAQRRAREVWDVFRRY